jgi:aspartyl/glutamyl-tRNA(Asn/Gln) amidotransferase C subunit
MDIQTIQEIETLSRLIVAEGDSERESFTAKMDAVLSYIDTVLSHSVSSDLDMKTHDHINITREDISNVENLEFRAQFLANAPHVEDGYIKVAKVM